MIEFWAYNWRVPCTLYEANWLVFALCKSTGDWLIPLPHAANLVINFPNGWVHHRHDKPNDRYRMILFFQLYQGQIFFSDALAGVIASAVAANTAIDEN